MLGGGGAQKGEWYFYNPQLVKQGQQEWRRRWGTRPLEDNWRRQNKQVVASDFPANQEEGEQGTDTLGSTAAAADTLAPKPLPRSTDPHDPNYYLQQIPRTEQDYALSDSLWRDAMVALYFIYRDRLEDQPQAEETLRELERRFPNHSCLDPIYEDRRMQALRHDEAYIARMQRMLAEQDSLYAQTYRAYTKGEFAVVKANKLYADTAYSQSALLPRFLFLNAVAVARTEGQDAFVRELQQLVARFGDSEMGAMAKDMLAMMGQGMESQKGGATGGLAELRDQTETDTPEDTEKEQQQWSEDRNQPSVVLLILPKADETALNELQYEVALFNFSQFLIRDFDLQKMPVFGTGCALRVSGFADMDEAEWWIDLLQKNAEMQRALVGVTVRPVTEVNLPLVK